MAADADWKKLADALRTLNNEAELSVWLTEVEQLLTDKLKTGPVAL